VLADLEDILRDVKPSILLQPPQVLLNLIVSKRAQLFTKLTELVVIKLDAITQHIVSWKFSMVLPFSHSNPRTLPILRPHRQHSFLTLVCKQLIQVVYPWVHGRLEAVLAGRGGLV